MKTLAHFFRGDASAAQTRVSPQDTAGHEPVLARTGELTPRNAQPGAGLQRRTAILRRPGTLPPGPAARLRTSHSAPVVTLEGPALQTALAKLEASLEGWCTKTSLVDMFRRGPGTKADWNRRVQNIATALRFVKPDATNVAYVVNGQPVALMSLSRPNGFLSGKPRAYLEIHALASHPGTEGAGGALVEHAVNASKQAGLQGKVRLQALHSAIPAYQAMGFKRCLLRDGWMELDPAKSHKWIQQDGQWRLAKHAAKGYVAAIGEPAPAPGRGN